MQINYNIKDNSINGKIHKWPDLKEKKKLK